MKPYKHKTKVMIILESNNFPKMQEIAYELYKTGSLGDPDDKDNYIAVSSTIEENDEKEKTNVMQKM